MPVEDDPAALIAASCDEPVSPLVTSAAAHLGSLFGDSALAVIGYGSCIRDTDPTDGLLDLYVIVSDYRAAYRQRRLRWANRVLPPNVFYAALPLGDATVRVKYGVIAMTDFEGGLTRAFLPYLWGRFAQPSRLVWARDQATREGLVTAFAGAAQRLLKSAQPLVPSPFTADELWVRALALSYATELRPESPERARVIVSRDADYYRRLTAALAAAGRIDCEIHEDGTYVDAPVKRAKAARARLAWFGRRWLGRGAAVLRLAKASLTFSGGVDYAAWKIERHTGTSVTVTPRLRRYPLIFGWGVLWRLLRRRLLR